MTGPSEPGVTRETSILAPSSDTVATNAASALTDPSSPATTSAARSAGVSSAPVA